MKSIKMFVVMAGLSLTSFAGEVKLSPGTSVTTKAGEETTVSCGGTSV